jgi:DNA-binding protein Fis
LPEVVRGERRRNNGRMRGVDLEALTYQVVQEGLSNSGPEEDNLHSKIVNRVERELIAQVMLTCNNVQTKAATKLGINRNTLHKKLKEYNLES